MNSPTFFLLGAASLAASALVSAEAFAPSKQPVAPQRPPSVLCEEVRRELELYEPHTNSLTPDDVKQIVNRCYRSIPHD